MVAGAGDGSGRYLSRRIVSRKPQHYRFDLFH
jgi:hypothetical protein